MERLSWLMDLLRVELTRFAASNQLSGVLESCWPVEALPKGLPDQRADRRMAPTLAPMDIREQIVAFFP